MSIWSRIERRLSDFAGELLPDELRQQATAARSLLERGQAAGAAEVLQAVLEERPGYTDARCLLGVTYLELDRAADAREAFARVLDDRPAMPEALLGMAQAELSLDRVDAAIAGFRATVNAASGDRGVLALAYRGLGMAYRCAGDIEKAVRELRKAVTENADDMLARAALGEALVADPRVSGDEARHHLHAVADAPAGTTPPTREHRAARIIAYLTLGRVCLGGEEDATAARDFFIRALETLQQEQRASAPELAPGAEADTRDHAGSGAGSDTRDDAGDEDGHAPAAHASRQRREHAIDQQVSALVGLGDAAMLTGDAATARDCYTQALGLRPRTAAVHARIGDMHARAGDTHAALARYEQALALAQDPAVLQRALDTALQADAPSTTASTTVSTIDTAVRLARDLLAVDPRNPRATVAQGLGMARQGQHEAARAMFRAALAMGDDIEAHLALGRLELALEPGRAGGTRAAAEALAALRIAPASPRARALLADARARELEIPGGDLTDGSAGGSKDIQHGQAGEDGQDAAAGAPADDVSAMYLLAQRLQRLALARSELAELAGEAARTAADFDRPLLVTVMGEFSSGKSTFVNAFIGNDVAPTGITPTTATINVVKYGREPGGRICYRDGRVETMDWDTLLRALRGIDADHARRIDVVEILYPLPQLAQVNIVDTPGLNSILPEHEEVARAFIARADAVVWLFTASQAGKASERRALARIHAEGTRVLGVLNKMDQLGEDELRQLVAYVQGELGELVEMVVPVAARPALAHRRAAEDSTIADQARGSDRSGDGASSGNGDSDSDGGDGNWPALEAALEQRFFAQARQLKRDACSRRLAAVVESAHRILAPMRQRATDAAASLRQTANALTDACPAFIDEVVVRERNHLQDAVTTLYHRAAREVLELVRPRQLPFGSHSATPADRDYLIWLLDSGYEDALDRCRRAVAQSLQSSGTTALTAIASVAPVLGSDAVSDVARTAEDTRRLVDAQVFDAAHAYLRGFVRGGYVASFFRHDLPKLELDESSVYDVLLRGSPDLDREIAIRLATAGIDAISALAGRLTHWAEVAEVQAYDLEVGVERALVTIERERERLTGMPVSAENQSRSDAADPGNR